MNKIQIIGRITKTPIVEETSNGLKFCRFNLASKSKIKSENGDFATDFFTVVAWRDKADLVAKYCSTGDLVYVSGTMKSRKYEEHIIWETNLDDIEFCTSKAEREKSGIKAETKAERPDLTPLSEEEQGELPF